MKRKLLFAGSILALSCVILFAASWSVPIPGGGHAVRAPAIDPTDGQSLTYDAATLATKWTTVSGGTNSGGSAPVGTMVNTTASTAGQVAIFSDTTKTNLQPSSALTNLIMVNPTMTTPTLGVATGTSASFSGAVNAGSGTLTNIVVVGANALGALDIDWSLSGMHTKTIGVNSTFTFSNAKAGEWITIKVTASGAFTATWPTVTWRAGLTPTQTASKVDFYTFFFDGTTYYGYATQNF